MGEKHPPVCFPRLFVKLQIEYVYSRRRVEATGDIVPGTVGNLWMDVRNSKVTSSTFRGEDQSMVRRGTHATIEVAFFFVVFF